MGDLRRPSSWNWFVTLGTLLLLAAVAGGSLYRPTRDDSYYYSRYGSGYSDQRSAGSSSWDQSQSGEPVGSSSSWDRCIRCPSSGSGSGTLDRGNGYDNLGYGMPPGSRWDKGSGADQEMSITENTTTTALLDVIMGTGSLRRGAVVLEAARRGTEAPHHTSHICMTEMVPVPATAEIWVREAVRPAAGYQQWGQIPVLPRQHRQRPPNDLQTHSHLL